jgi:hypothetical protein
MSKLSSFLTPTYTPGGDQTSTAPLPDNTDQIQVPPDNTDQVPNDHSTMAINHTTSSSQVKNSKLDRGYDVLFVTEYVIKCGWCSYDHDS